MGICTRWGYRTASWCDKRRASRLAETSHAYNHTWHMQYISWLYTRGAEKQGNLVSACTACRHGCGEPLFGQERGDWPRQFDACQYIPLDSRTPDSAFYIEVYAPW